MSDFSGSLVSGSEEFETSSRSISSLDDPSRNYGAVFGGQGPNEIYFEELSNLYDLHRPILSTFLSLASKHLIDLSAAEKKLYHLGFSFLDWFELARPPTSYLASPIISMPLIALTQLCHYILLGHQSNLGPARLGTRFCASTGHSQGIISAVIIGFKYENDDWTDFYNRGIEGITMLFHIALQGTRAFNPMPVPPKFVAASIEKGEGVPSAMLAVNGISLRLLQEKVESVKRYLEGTGEISTIDIRLFNGSNSYVVNGQPLQLLNLVQTLRGAQADENPSLDKIHHSNRLESFTMGFFPITIPFHSQLLTDCTAKALKSLDISNWNPAQLAIPVYSTHDGHDLREEGSNLDLVTNLLDQVLCLTVDWAKAVNFPAATTHVIDFGTGAGSGIGTLCTKLFEGTGISTIFLGHRVGGSRALEGEFDGESDYLSAAAVVNGVNWSQYSPKLVKTGDGKIHLDTSLSRLLRRSPIVVSESDCGTGAGRLSFISAITSAGFTLEAPSSIASAVESIKESISTGTKHITFKPVNVDEIQLVIGLAKAYPVFPIIINWSGANGFYSWQDFHTPILETYASIRSQSNIILVGGGGFGADDAHDVIPYLSGSWSESFGVRRMPFDGFSYGPRVKTVLESPVSQSVKQLICDCTNRVDSHEDTISIISDSGESMQVIETRGSKLWSEFDRVIFSLPKEKQLVYLTSSKPSIIKKLNSDFQKPWFGVKKSGQTCDMEDMTYLEVIDRLVQLFYVAEKRLIDPGYQRILGDWFRRVEEIMVDSELAGAQTSIIQSYSELNRPIQFVARFLNEFPAISKNLITDGDVSFLLNSFKNAGRKSIPFIPILDESFGRWFKQDSFWQAQDIEAVFDQDVQRIIVVAEPFSVKFSTSPFQSIKDLLNGIDQALIKNVLEDFYAIDESRIPVIEYLAVLPPMSSTDMEFLGIKKSIEQQEDGSSTCTYQITDNLPSLEDWIHCVSGSTLSWLRAFLENASRSSQFYPELGQRVLVDYDKQGIPLKIEVYDLEVSV